MTGLMTAWGQDLLAFPQVLGRGLLAALLGVALMAHLERAMFLSVAAGQEIPDPPKKTVLGFSTKLCPGCVRMKREIEARPDASQRIKAAFDVKLYDANRDRDVADKYGITAVPACVLLDAGGKELKRFVGYKSLPELLRWLELEK